MPDVNHATQLARFDEIVAENDARESPNAKWRAANAVYEKAELVESLDGGDAAIGLYADVVRRLEGCRESGPRELLICAMNSVASLHHQQGRDRESRSAAEALVQDHFDDAPPEAAAAVVDGALLLGRLLNNAGEHAQALELYERVVERYGRSGVPDHHLTAAAATSSAAWVVGTAGRLDEAIKRYDHVIEEIGDTVDPVLRRILAGAMVHKAHFLRDENRLAQSDSVCREVVRRFDSDDNPEIAEHVAWARRRLGENTKRPRRSLLRPRR